MHLGRGGFSWRSVLSMVPGIQEDPPLGTFSRAGGRGGAAHNGPQGPTFHSDPFDRIRGAIIVSRYFLLNWGIVGAEGRGWIPVTFRWPQGLDGSLEYAATISIRPVAVWFRSLTLWRMI